MCECGCSEMFLRYTFPAPGKSLYLLTICQHCVGCDAPSGMSIELIEPSNILFKDYRSGEFINGPLPFSKWKDSKGVSFAFGLTRHEFIAAALEHLVGIDSSELGENGKIDRFGADVIAEEMYESVQKRPSLVG